MMKIKYLFLLSAFAFMISCNQKQETVIEPVSVLKSDAQDIEVYDLDGLEKILSKKDENIHVVNFWATWCAPCIKEIPHFEKVNKEVEGVDVTLVSIDNEDDFERLTKFVGKKGYESDVAVVTYTDDQKLIDTVDKNWTGGNIPVTVIYNKHKKKFISGSVTHDELMAEIEKFKS